ncbi:MAG TPA: anhydro-N-acetylmuramic acid kinase [Candidatus Sulfotelmatobacter sp.]|nr:anhydro-N-acetylmuramic acid kinase [Candidatus Sulfotelmatobacter sp.]
MIVAGVMTGTSVDGIDVSVVRITRSSPRALPTIKLLGHEAFPYPADVRRRILVSMNSPRASVADLARLNFLLGELYAEAVNLTRKKLRVKPELVGCHGQTLYHQGSSAEFLGRKLAVTWQTGEAAVIAARTGLPVVSDFRPADMAHGGKGAPLVPYLDFLIYRDRRIGRVGLNLGGIANLTAIPAAASLNQIIAFDTGPGNMVIDALAEELFGQECDRDGEIAASGRVLEEVVAGFLKQEPFFLQKPPRTAGREQFGREFAREFLHASRPLGTASRKPVGQGASAALADGSAVEKRDVIATATALTVRSIGDSVRRFVPRKGNFKEMIVSGGGAKNPTLMRWLEEEVRALGLRLRSSDEFGIPSSAKEAVAFAVLAYETWNKRPANVPSATGAKSAAVLGKVCYP